MELYACGFNAHNQLTFNETREADPKDIPQLRRLLSAEYIDILFTGWSNLVLDVDHVLKLNGARLDGSSTSPNYSTIQNIQKENAPEKEDVRTIFGDHTGVLGGLNRTGKILIFDPEHSTFKPHNPPGPAASKTHLSIAGNGKVATCYEESYSDPEAPPLSSGYGIRKQSVSHHRSTRTIIHEYLSLDDFLQHHDLGQSGTEEIPALAHKEFILHCSPRQLVANQTAFTFLDDLGNVYTWGDGRHNHLGREITSATPASTPGFVESLGGIPIRKVVSGGWVTAAVSRDRDLYLWGGRPGEGQWIRELPHSPARVDEEGVEEDVALANVDGGVDIVDVAVGDGHVVVLTAEGKLFAAGRGGNGQLGCGGMEFAEAWREMQFEEGDASDKSIVGVFCGPWYTLVLCRIKR
ncbi:RCC1/BLIP-II protein [Xylona heveae TC161]|uniref:RCC1/BLIP-II protein n=1 Tax=Xylona heveae (strain CBS 132557 / TC161) TaxID=1328760 RepID=A0A165A4I9_XYLHT|nr:RCC1/BLIP-II protein [Xylona heveae TC161]KZF19936.1 RCC1/BLIP-II protein [Xylona heveae TC161]